LWFTILGFMRMLAMLTRDRFEYVCVLMSACIEAGGAILNVAVFVLI
jgi:hypothetical protein